jgi:hypothetical protein
MNRYKKIIPTFNPSKLFTRNNFLKFLSNRFCEIVVSKKEDVQFLAGDFIAVSKNNFLLCETANCF